MYPWNSFADPHSEAAIKLADAALLDPVNIPIPLVDRPAWALCRRVHQEKRVVRLGDVAAFSVTRGEINQTIYRRFITDQRRGMARLLKGVEVGRYTINDKLNGGASRERVHEDRFQRENTPRPIVQRRRIATQRITGVDERHRIVATVVEPPMFFRSSPESVRAPVAMRLLAGARR